MRTRWATVSMLGIVLCLGAGCGNGSAQQTTGALHVDPTPTPSAATPSEPSPSRSAAAPASPAAGRASESDSPQTGPRVVITRADGTKVTVGVEVANTDPLRQRGLMFRRNMPEMNGMLFLFDQAEHLTFWMHNTYIPLDMVFITSDMKILGIVENAVPQTDSTRSVPGDSQYVLEVNGGFARRHDLGRGLTVEFVDVPEGAAPRGSSHAE